MMMVMIMITMNVTKQYTEVRQQKVRMESSAKVPNRDRPPFTVGSG